MNTTLPQSGEVFDFRYRIACRLGRGADGYVFGATELETGKRVAIKCWIGPHAEQALAAAQQFVRSAHEARLFENPHVVEVFAAEAGRTVNYCVMDWLEGMTLSQRISRRRPSPLHDVFNIVVPCMRAIAEAHAAGIVHGDIRPGHIFVCHATRHRQSIARIFDFGRGLAGLAATPSLVRDVGDEVLQYAAPEQLIGVPPDARSDTYAFGVMLFEMLAGERAFSADSTEELARKIKDGATKLLASISPAIPVRLAHVVERAMAVDPQQRFASLAEMIDALAPFDPRTTPVFATRPVADTATDTATDTVTELVPPPVRRPAPPTPGMPMSKATTLMLPGRTRSSKTPPPPPPPRRSVGSPKPPPAAASFRREPPEEITTTSASWELTEPIRMRSFQLERLFARIGGRQRAAVWCLVLMASMIAARAVQRMAAPAFERSAGPQPQQAAPGLLDLDPPDCGSVVGATDPRCAHAPRLPQPGAAAPIRPSSAWTPDTNSVPGASALDAADSGMRDPAAPAPPGQRTAARKRGSGAQEARSLNHKGRAVAGHGAPVRATMADEDFAIENDEEEAAPVRKRSATNNVTSKGAKPEARPTRRSRDGASRDGGSRSNDPFERLDRMRLQ